MSTIITLMPEQFDHYSQELLRNEYFTVNSYKFSSGIEAITIKNNRGFVTVLPFYGQMIWDAEFDGTSLKMTNMFSEPKYGQDITDTYGCFAFHSGLLSNGCPSAEDTHIMHGEMSCAKMNKAWLEIDGDTISICGLREYVKGFGDHYLAKPSVTLTANKSIFDINMEVTNVASVPMPLQYMCHINYAYIDNATFEQNIPTKALKLRQTIPAHVKPTEQWLNYTKKLSDNPGNLVKLNEPQFYDPEIVFFIDNISKYTDKAEFFMSSPNGTRFVTRFSTDQFNYGTRWILYNGDQQVAAFILPSTCRPEGFLAARKSGSLIMIPAGETKAFKVSTGIDILN